LALLPQVPAVEQQALPSRHPIILQSFVVVGGIVDELVGTEGVTVENVDVVDLVDDVDIVELVVDVVKVELV